MSHHSKQTSAAIREFDDLPDSAHVRLPVLQALFSCSDETIRRRVKAGQLPAPKKLGPRMTGWRVGDIREALAAVKTKAA